VERERAHQGLTRLIVTEDMHTRKARMVALSDAFLALPGGYGTLDELFEVTTWRQLGIHRKPIGLLDRGGFWTGLLAFLATAEEAGFIGRDCPKPAHGDDVEGVLDQLFADAEKITV